jgi:predicted TIM-barrel fold metal-dependent hydrolase
MPEQAVVLVTSSLRRFATGLLCFAAILPAYGASNVLPIIDAHSQFDEHTPVARVIEYASRAGVNQVLLSFRGRTTTRQVLDLGSAHPTCIVPSVRTKGRAFAESSNEYYAMLDEQFREPGFRAMSEIILAHAAKGRRVPEVNVAADTPQVREAIRRAMAKGWPIVLHYEFRWLTKAYGSGARPMWISAKRIAELKDLLAQHPQQPFALIHMGQLDPGDAADLLAAHPNLLFMTSHANTLVVHEGRQPWTDMFAGEELTAEWKALVLRYPDRFVLTIDNVWPEHWSDRYVQQVELWRKALGKLPTEVAHAVAHGNAERLWKLPLAMPGEGCAGIKYSASEADAQSFSSETAGGREGTERSQRKGRKRDQ